VTRQAVFALLGTAALVACSSPDPNLYMLVPEHGTVLADPLPPIRLGPVTVARYLDRPQIVHHRTPYELDYSDTERWGEALDDMVPRILAEDLTQRLPDTRIALQSSDMMNDAARSLPISIERFDADPSGTVILEARWAVRNHGGGAAALEEARIEKHAASSETPDLVAAMSDCLGELSDRLAAALAQHGAAAATAVESAH
jgi:uncharacterized protein